MHPGRAGPGDRGVPCPLTAFGDAADTASCGLYANIHARGPGEEDAVGEVRRGLVMAGRVPVDKRPRASKRGRAWPQVTRLRPRPITYLRRRSLRGRSSGVADHQSGGELDLNSRPAPVGDPVQQEASGVAAEPPHPQRQHDELARRRQITRKSQVGAVYSPRPAPAPRTGRPPCGRTGLDPDDRVDHLDRFHQNALDRGKQQLVQLRQHFVHGEGLSTTPPSSQAIFGRTLVVVGGQCAHDWLAAHEPGSTHQTPLESII